MLTFVFNQVCKTGLPQSWNQLKLTSLYKNKGDSKLATNYRGLCIMSTVAKLYALALNHKIEMATVTLGLRAPTQGGFRRNFKLEDNCIVFKTVLEKMNKANRNLFCIFIDLEKAYDNVPRHLLWESLCRQNGFDEELIIRLQQLYYNIFVKLSEDTECKLGQINSNFGLK